MNLLNTQSGSQLAAFLLFMILPLCGFGQKVEVNWLSWEEATKLSESEPRKIFIDIQTSWCGWCKKMDKATFQKKDIATFLNENYYPVRMDGESEKVMVYKGKEFKPIRKGKDKYHELVVFLTRGSLSYPTIVFLDENQNVLQAIPGFRSADEFERMMTYFYGDFFKQTSWRTYVRNYIPISQRKKLEMRTRYPSKVANSNNN